MYARITTFRSNPDRYDDATELAEELKPEIMSLPGIKFWFDAGNIDGDCVVIAVYDSKESADSAMPVARELFGRFGEFMESAPQPQEYEVFVHGTNP